MSKSENRHDHRMKVLDRMLAASGNIREAKWMLGVFDDSHKRDWKAMVLRRVDVGYNMSKQNPRGSYQPLVEDDPPPLLTPQEKPAGKKFKSYVPNRYPWDEWFTEKPKTILKGRDYTSTQAGMIANIRRAASKRGIRVSLKVTDTYITMRVVG